MAKFEQMTDEQLICRLRDGDKTVIDYVMENIRTWYGKKRTPCICWAERITT